MPIKIKEVLSKLRKIKTSHIILFLISLSFVSFFTGFIYGGVYIIFPSEPYQIPSDRIPLNYSVDFISYLDKHNSFLVINSTAVSVLDESSFEITWQYRTNWYINSHKSLISMNQNAILLAGDFVSFIEIGALQPQWTFNNSGIYTALSISKNEHLFTFRNTTNTFVYHFSEEKWNQVLKFNENPNYFLDERTAFFDRYYDVTNYETAVILSDKGEWIIRVIENENNFEFYRKNDTSYNIESNPFSNDTEIFKTISEYPNLAYFSQNDTVLVGFTSYNIIYANFTDFSVKTHQFISDDDLDIYHYKINKQNSLIFSTNSSDILITQFDLNQTDSSNLLIKFKASSWNWNLIWPNPNKTLLYKIEHRVFSAAQIAYSNKMFPFLECYNYTSLTKLWWGANEEYEIDSYSSKGNWAFDSVESFRVNPINKNGDFFYFNRQLNEINFYTGNLTNEGEWKDPQSILLVNNDLVYLFFKISFISLCFFIGLYILEKIGIDLPWFKEKIAQIRSKY